MDTARAGVIRRCAAQEALVFDNDEHMLCEGHMFLYKQDRPQTGMMPTCGHHIVAAQADLHGRSSHASWCCLEGLLTAFQNEKLLRHRDSW